MNYTSKIKIISVLIMLCLPLMGWGEMLIEDISISDGVLTVTTTGAEYILRDNTVEMWRRIDPATNDYGNPRKVAELSFNQDIGTLTIESQNTLEANISSDLADFQFNSDSFFFIKAKGEFSYTHKNLISNAPWNKPEQEYLWSGLDRMWTDGYGGSLHAFIKGTPTATTSIDFTTINMNSGDIMGEMVYPPQRFDFERLYGAGARPFVYIQTGTKYVGTLEDLNFLSLNLDKLRDKGFGIIVLWNDFYKKVSGYEQEQYFPYLLDSGVYGYEFNYSQEIKDFISKAHNEGFKVIAYIQTGRFNPSQARPAYEGDPQVDFNGQDVDTTLQWMRDFQRDYTLDGFYLDGAGIYRLGSKNLEGNYNFIKQVRENVDIIAKEHGVANGIIYHHDSLDVWDDYAKYRGLRAIMIDAYVDYTLTGETDYTVNSNENKGMSAQIDSPNDIYLRFYTSGYGLSQAYATYVRMTNNKAAISKEEYARTMGENLNGIERIYYIGSIDNSWWKNYFKPAYEKRKLAYLSHPDVNWPLNLETTWFRVPKDIKIEFLENTTVKISWKTNEPATSEVAYTSNEVWWDTLKYPQYPEGPDGEVINEALVTDHSIILAGLTPQKNYELRIRSRNGKDGDNEIIYGYVGSFVANIANRGLQAVITATPEKGKVPLEVHFDGSESSGNIVKYIWNFGNGNNFEGVEIKYTYTAQGTYEVQLSITDEESATSTTLKKITVYPEYFALDNFNQTTMVCLNNIINPKKNEKATIQLYLTEELHVILVVYDNAGKQIKILCNELKQANLHTWDWDGTDENYRLVGSGIYFVHMQAGSYKETKKIAVVK